MSKGFDEDLFSFTITIVAVKMKVKFPCRMALEQAGKTLTQEVEQNQDGKFLFNQEVHLTQDNQKLFA